MGIPGMRGFREIGFGVPKRLFRPALSVIFVAARKLRLRVRRIQLQDRIIFFDRFFMFDDYRSAN